MGSITQNLYTPMLPYSDHGGLLVQCVYCGLILRQSDRDVHLGTHCSPNPDARRHVKLMPSIFSLAQSLFSHAVQLLVQIPIASSVLKGFSSQIPYIQSAAVSLVQGTPCTCPAAFDIDWLGGHSCVKPGSSEEQPKIRQEIKIVTSTCRMK